MTATYEKLYTAEDWEATTPIWYVCKHSGMMSQIGLMSGPESGGLVNTLNRLTSPNEEIYYTRWVPLDQLFREKADALDASLVVARDNLRNIILLQANMVLQVAHAEREVVLLRENHHETGGEDSAPA